MGKMKKEKTAKDVPGTTSAKVDFDALFAPPEGMTTVDDWLDAPRMEATPAEAAARLVIEVHRMPAWKQMLYQPIMPWAVWCMFRGQRCKLRHASRLGTLDLTTDKGKSVTGWVQECSDWSIEPVPRVT